MTIVIVACLAILIFCVLFLAIQIKSQNQKQEDSLVQIMLQKKEEETRSAFEQQQIQKTFQQLNNQVQNLAKESALSQQSLSWMHENIQSMNKIMTNTKRRGNWGEYQLESLLKIYAGENPRIFSMQFMLNNHKIADAILHLPGTDKILCIDSKFPVENFLKIEEDPRKDDITALLPGANCGACGYPGCSGLAEAMVEGKSTKASDCKVIKGDKQKALQDYLDNMKK